VRKLAFLPFLLALVSCAQLGLAPAQSFKERLAYAYGTHTAVLQAATGALTAQDITSEDAERVLKISDEARRALDAGRLAFDAGDLATAEARVNLATSILVELQTYLRNKR